MASCSCDQMIINGKEQQKVYIFLAIVATVAEKLLQVGMNNSAWSEPWEQIFTVAEFMI